jgi:hypothetical protein
MVWYPLPHGSQILREAQTICVLQTTSLQSEGVHGIFSQNFERQPCLGTRCLLLLSLAPQIANTLATG